MQAGPRLYRGAQRGVGRVKAERDSVWTGAGREAWRDRGRLSPWHRVSYASAARTRRAAEQAAGLPDIRQRLPCGSRSACPKQTSHLNKMVGLLLRPLDKCAEISAMKNQDPAIPQVPG